MLNKHMINVWCRFTQIKFYFAVKTKRKNTMLTIINIILILLVIAMFAISMSGNRPTVLNYRRTIENEYSSWKQQLDEREQAVREKERELGIVYGDE